MVRRASSWVIRYGIAIASVAVALGGASLFGPAEHVASVVFLAAVTASAYFAGLGPGLVATVLSALVLDYLYFPPLHSVTLGAATWVWLAGYLGTALLINWFQDAQWRAVSALRLQNRRKSEFMAMLAHELRNFLSPVSASVAAVQLRAPGDPVIAEACGLVERQVQNMTHLIDDLLDVARITQGKVRLSLETLDLRTVLDRVTEGVRPQIDGRGHRLEVSLPAGPLPLRADATRLEQILLNLLANAAKYTDPGGRIRVIVERRQRHLVVRVRDNGRGLAPDVLPHVFDLFSQAQAGGEGGLGVGLSLVKGLVEMHGGSVTALSAGAGRGSEFIVRFPEAEGPAQHKELDLADGRPQGTAVRGEGPG
jgi:signal transduction histidine kinase